MERSKSEVMENEKPRWRKLGGGSLRIGKRIIKPGQVFSALPEEISPGFRNMVEPVSGNAVFKDKIAPTELPPPPENIVKPVYNLKLHKGFTMEPKGKSPLWFNVLNEKGEVVNEKVLKKADAEKLVEESNVWFDVVDGNEKILNEKPLKKELAEKLVADLLR